MSNLPRPVATERNERVVCAVLSAQAADLRNRIDTSATIDLLLRMTDVMASLSALVVELSQRAGTADPQTIDPQLAKQCRDGIFAAAEIGHAVDDLTFVQAQHQDFVRQLADCLVKALDRLSEGGTHLSEAELAALYVSEEQRQVHAAVTGRLETDEPTATKNDPAEGSRQ
jgi:hypothetical protein